MSDFDSILGFGEKQEDTFFFGDDSAEIGWMFSEDDLANLSAALDGPASPIDTDCSSVDDHFRPDWVANTEAHQQEADSSLLSDPWQQNTASVRPAQEEEHGLHQRHGLDLDPACQDACYSDAETESFETEDHICEACTTSIQAPLSPRLNKPKKARLPRTAAKKSATQRPKSSIAKKEPAAKALPWAKTEKAKHTNKKCMQQYRAQKQSIIKGRVRKELGRRYASWRRAPDSRESCSQGISERYQAFITELEQRSEEEQQNVPIPTWPNPKA